jgi:hypothetical protein
VTVASLKLQKWHYVNLYKPRKQKEKRVKQILLLPTYIGEGENKKLGIPLGEHVL